MAAGQCDCDHDHAHPGQKADRYTKVNAGFGFLANAISYTVGLAGLVNIVRNLFTGFLITEFTVASVGVSAVLSLLLVSVDRLLHYKIDVYRQKEVGVKTPSRKSSNKSIAFKEIETTEVSSSWFARALMNLPKTLKALLVLDWLSHASERTIKFMAIFARLQAFGIVVLPWLGALISTSLFVLSCVSTLVFVRTCGQQLKEAENVSLKPNPNPDLKNEASDWRTRINAVVGFAGNLSGFINGQFLFFQTLLALIPALSSVLSLSISLGLAALFSLILVSADTVVKYKIDHRNQLAAEPVSPTQLKEFTPLIPPSQTVKPAEVSRHHAHGHHHHHHHEHGLKAFFDNAFKGLNPSLKRLTTISYVAYAFERTIRFLDLLVILNFLNVTTPALAVGLSAMGFLPISFFSALAQLRTQASQLKVDEPEPEAAGVTPCSSA